MSVKQICKVAEGRWGRVCTKSSMSDMSQNQLSLYINHFAAGELQSQPGAARVPVTYGKGYFSHPDYPVIAVVCFKGPGPELLLRLGDSFFNGH